MQLPLCQPHYTSENAGAGLLGGGAQRMYNLYPVRVTDEPGKTRYNLITTPGLRTLATTANNLACRGAYFTSTGRLFSIHGAVLYEIASAGTATSRGSISTSSGNVSMTDNGIHLLIADGTLGYTLTLASNTLTSIADVNFPDASLSVTFQDGYIIAAKTGTGEFYLSALLDATDWTPATFATAEFRADNLMAVKSIGAQLYLIGEQTSEVHYNTGNASFPFERINGASFDVGTSQGETVAALNDSLFFLGNGSGGRGSVWMIQGTSIKRVSTPAIENLMSRHTMSSSYGYCYQQDGHQFYVLCFPSNGFAYAFDITENAWHQRASGAGLSMYKARKIIGAFSSGAEYPYGFDIANGNIYEVSGAYNLEDGTAALRSVGFGPVFTGRNRAFYKNLRMDMDTQADSIASMSVTVTLGVSDTGGATTTATYTDAKTIPTYNPAQFSFYRLGSSRERYFGISFSGPFRAALKGAEAEIEQGRF